MILCHYLLTILIITAACLAGWGMSPGFAAPSLAGWATLLPGCYLLGLVLGAPLLVLFALFGHSPRRRHVTHPGVWALAGLVAGLICGVILVLFDRLALVWFTLAGGELMALFTLLHLRRHPPRQTS